LSNQKNSRRRGLLCVISSPSGGGKSSIIHEILKRHPEYRYSISATTRPPRQYEKNGVHYYFLSDDEFERRLARGEFIEWAWVHGHRYGTLKEPIENMLENGDVVLLDIDVIGGGNVRKLFPDRSLLIFLKPPSVKELIRRLKGRRSETEAQIRKRLDRLPMELAAAKDYDVVIVNDDFLKTVEQVEEEIEKALKKQEVDRA